MLVDILIILSACPGKPSSRRAFFSVGSHFKASGDEHWGTWKSPLTLTPPLDGSGLGSKVLKLRGPFMILCLWYFYGLFTFLDGHNPKQPAVSPYLWALATCIRYTVYVSFYNILFIFILYLVRAHLLVLSLPRDLSCLAESLDRSTRRDLPACFEASVPHCPAHTFWNFPQGWISAGHCWW